MDYGRIFLFDLKDCLILAAKISHNDSVFYDRRRRAPASIAGRLGREAQRPMSDSESDVPDEVARAHFSSLAYSSMRRVENQGSPALRQW